MVTGIGVVSTAGVGHEALWTACLNGRTSVEPTPPRWAKYYLASSQVWSPLPSVDFTAYGLSKTDKLLLSKPAMLGLVAAQQALDMSELPKLSNWRNAIDPSRKAVHVGTGLGAAQTPFDNYAAHLLGPLRSTLEFLSAQNGNTGHAQELLQALQANPRVNPLVICQTMPNALAANIAIKHGFRGAVETYCSACAAGTVAIGKAFRAIKSGEADFVLAGGIEHLADRAGAVFMGFDRLQALAAPHQGLGTENRPFDVSRSGFLFSEGGAAVVVLEDLESVLRRGAKNLILAEVVGFGESCDAHSIAAVSSERNAFDHMLSIALGEASVTTSQIDYINSHGTGTLLNDQVESEFIMRQFGTRPLVNSSKSILGHSIGASGALEFAITVLSLRHQTVHPSINLTDPIADLNFCTAATKAPLDYAITQSFGFGGHNAALVVRRSDPTGIH